MSQSGSPNGDVELPGVVPQVPAVPSPTASPLSASPQPSRHSNTGRTSPDTQPNAARPTIPYTTAYLLEKCRMIAPSEVAAQNERDKRREQAARNPVREETKQAGTCDCLTQCIPDRIRNYFR